MSVLQANVRPTGSGFGVAGRNLTHVLPLIEERVGLSGMVSGTLNLALRESYIVPPDVTIAAAEYNGREFIKLHRCLIRGVRAVIMRPNTHELSPPWGHGPAHIELLSHIHLRTALGLQDNEAVEVEVECPLERWHSAR